MLIVLTTLALALAGVEPSERCAAGDIPACEALLIRDLQVIGAWLARGEQPPRWRHVTAHQHLHQLLVLRHLAGDTTFDRDGLVSPCRLSATPGCRELVPQQPLRLAVDEPTDRQATLEGRVRSWLQQPRAGIEVWLIARRESVRLPTTFEQLNRASRAVAHTTTDEAGRFRFEGVRVDGDWTILAIDEQEWGRLAEVQDVEAAVEVPIRPHEYGARPVTVVDTDGTPATDGWLSFPWGLLPVDGAPHWARIVYETRWEPQLFAWGGAGRTAALRGEPDELPDPMALTLPDGPPRFCRVQYPSGDTYGLYDGPCLDVPWTETESLRGARWVEADGGFQVTLANDFLLLLPDRTPIIAYQLTDDDGRVVEPDELGYPRGTYDLVGWLEPTDGEGPALVRGKATLPEGRHRVVVDATREQAPWPRILDARGTLFRGRQYACAQTCSVGRGHPRWARRRFRPTSSGRSRCPPSPTATWRPPPSSASSC